VTLFVQLIKLRGLEVTGLGQQRLSRRPASRRVIGPDAAPREVL